MERGIIELKIEDGLHTRLEQAARERSVTVQQLVELILKRFIDTDDDPAAWISATQQQLPRVWPKEDFSSWSPPSPPNQHVK
jgi:hypothetical protein